MKILILMAVTAAALFAGGCGQPVPPNEVAIVVKTLGDRSTNVVDSSELYFAKRLPAFVHQNPSVKCFIFPLGLQEFEFTEHPTVESPEPDAIETDCLGGHLKFGLNVMLEIDRSLLKNPADMSAKLMSFISDHQLMSYSGSKDVLALWAKMKLKQFAREPLAQYTLTNQVIEIMRSKHKMNDIVLTRLNERFKKYGLVFRSVGICSSIHIPDDQRLKMANIVMMEYTNKVLVRRQQEFMPLTNALVNLELEGLNRAQNARNEGVTESINIVAEVQQERRKSFINLMGKEKYVEFEQLLKLTEALDGGRTTIEVVPSSFIYYGGSPAAPFAKN